MAEVVWSESSLDDIDEIAAFIARDSVYYANKMVSNIFDHTEILTVFPKAGRKISEKNDQHFREIQVSPFRVIYKLDGEVPIIMAVIHSKRKADKIVKKRK